MPDATVVIPNECNLEDCLKVLLDNIFDSEIFSLPADARTAKHLQTPQEYISAHQIRSYLQNM